MSDESVEKFGHYDHRLRVDTAPVPQTIPCPGCGHEFKELITGGRAIIGGGTCPECNDWIRYETGPRHNPGDDDTEQEGLDAFA